MRNLLDLAHAGTIWFRRDCPLFRGPPPPQGRNRNLESPAVDATVPFLGKPPGLRCLPAAWGILASKPLPLPFAVPLRVKRALTRAPWHADGSVQ